MSEKLDTLLCALLLLGCGSAGNEDDHHGVCAPEKGGCGAPAAKGPFDHACQSYREDPSTRFASIVRWNEDSKTRTVDVYLWHSGLYFGAAQVAPAWSNEAACLQLDVGDPPGCPLALEDGSTQAVFVANDRILSGTLAEFTVLGDCE